MAERRAWRDDTCALPQGVVERNPSVPNAGPLRDQNASSRRPEPSRRGGPLFGSPLKLACAAVLLVGAGALLDRTLANRAGSRNGAAALRPRDGADEVAAERGHAARKRRHARRLLYSGAALLAFSGTVDSGIEHYRGQFRNRAMYVAPSISAAALSAALAGIWAPERASGSSKAAFALSALTGLLGNGFHIYNVRKREGGISFNNLFYGAPLGAPAAVALAGLCGLAAALLNQGPRANDRVPYRRLLSSRALAWVSAGGLLGTVAEAALLHFRGAFQNPYMLLPVTLPVASAGVLLIASHQPTAARKRLARALLGGTALLGPMGIAFHTYGVQRMMGGWRNASQNVLAGPPLAAPPGFSGLALAGLASLSLQEASAS